jgi:hypothetical protein
MPRHKAVKSYRQQTGDDRDEAPGESHWGPLIANGRSRGRRRTFDRCLPVAQRLANG